MIQHPQFKPYLIKSQTLKPVEIEKFQTNLQMIDHWKSPEFEITDFDFQHDRTPSA